MIPIPAPTGNTAKAAIDGRSLRKVRGPKVASTRAGWHRGLSAEEMALPGSVLLSMLLRRANELGHNLGEMAAELSVTYGYISQLRSGKRKISDISANFSRACTRYLCVPRLTVLLASGRVNQEDFYSDPVEAISSLPQVIRLIMDDPKYGPLVPAELIDANQKLQYLIVALYEDATQKTLLPGRMSAPQIEDQIQRFQEIQDALITQTED